MSGQTNALDTATPPNALARMGASLTETSRPGTPTAEQTPKAAKRRRTAPADREEGELEDENRPPNDADMAGQEANPPPAQTNDAQTSPAQPTTAPANPHAQSSQRGPPPPEPTQSRIAYTRATYPRVVKSLDALLAEILETTADIIRAQPDKYLALLIYGGGNKIKEENPSLMADIQGFLQGLSIEGSERLRVVDPPKQDNEKKGEFAKPHILLLKNGSPKLRAYLTWYQTFAFQTEGRRIAFSALPFDANVRPWFIADITGQAVTDDPAAVHEGLLAITQSLSADTEFRNHVDACLAKVELPRSIDERVRGALSTFEIHSMRVTNKEKKEVIVWQLYANPIAGNGQEYKEWLTIITSRRYVIDEIDEIFMRTKTLKPYDSCAFCKSEIHPEVQCPFPLVADWKGPIPRDVRAERAKVKEEALARGGTRSRDNPRGGRGGNRGLRGGNPNTARAHPYQS
ncbi:hypothetical protein PTI98_011744 [Pleurotus ostreatus]|nr:hypothetical protein PTI98_011744 [Pleurotus ostreatus]